MRPLADVRIIAIEQYAAGPFGSVQLADLGADVIKIEDPATGGDIGRYVPPLQEDEDSLFFETFNRNKRSIGVDLKAPAGRAVFEDLVRVSDVVYSNLRGDVPQSLRINYGDLKHLNPRIVCCPLTGYGMTGSRRDELGYDYLLQGIAGWMDLTGEPSGPPAKSGLSLVDYSAGLVAAVAMLAGIHAARRDGVGMDCDISLFDTALAMLTYPAIWNLNGDFTPTRTHHSAHPSLVPFQAFQTRDRWIVVGCPKEKFWQRLVIAIDRPELATDRRFATFADRRRNAGELLPMLEAVFESRTAGEWLDILGRAGVPCSPVNTVPEALRDRQTADRGMVVQTEHPRFGAVRQLRSPVRVGDADPEYVRAPLRDEHREQVLRDLLGYDAARIADLGDRGAFGEHGPENPG
jgi:crotonobetainyl-CoA:carnitine CoA-transferase CaiB-like acyl-CoA transferase